MTETSTPEACIDAYEDEHIHVVPVNDIRDHYASADCWCEPELDEESEVPVYIHNPGDGRDKYESGERKLN